MRILALRGENLASLADAFEVDFEAEPIRSAGIFAITGPTGAGKTTLLDAICLALFDSLPRMDTAERGAAIGRVDGDSASQVKYDDVRGILRHGAGAGYAEIDFVGQDGRRYRSCWEVNHARNRASGRLQNQKITLTDIESGEIIGDKKTDTLQQIEKRIGLSFDQFRRSVLLAQGDFDTFIRAGSKDRAELLERITGTEIYSRISQAAYARAKQEREALRDLETQLGEHQPLSDEERAAAEARVTEAKTEVDRTEAERAAINKAQEWYNTKSLLDVQVAAGDAALTQALETDQAADTDRATLMVVKQAFSLRAELEAASATSRRLAEAEKALVSAMEAERKAVDARDQAVTASDAAKAERDEKRAAYDAIGPELDKAQRLDAMMETAKTDLATRKNLLERSLLAEDEARKVVVDVEDALKAARDQHERDGQWLVAHQSVEALSVRMEDVAQDLSERLTLEGGMASTREQIEQLEREVEAAEASRLQKETEIAALRKREHELSEQITGFRQVADAIDTVTVEAKRDTLTAIQAALEDAQDAAEDSGKAQAGIVTADEEAAHQHSLIRQACDVMAQVDAELPTDMARLEEARRSLDLSEAAGSEVAEHLRLKLADGQPCPVCGATEHPVTAVDRLLKDRVSADRRRVAELEAKVGASREDRTRAETQIAAAQDALQGITRRRSGREGELQTARERWRAAVAAVLNSCRALDVVVPTFAEDAAAAEATRTIGPFREMLDKILDEAKKTLRRASDAEAVVRKLSSECETVRADLTTAGDEIRKLITQEHAKANEVATLGATLQGMEQNFAAVCSRLDMVLTPVFPGWQEEVSNIGAAFAKVCRSLVDKWRECRQRMETAGTKISRLEADLEGRQATLKAAEVAVAEAERHYSDKKGELDELAAERLNVIGGRPVGDVRTEYQKCSEAAEQAWHEAEVTKSKAERDVAARSSDTVHARQACNAARTEHESAERVLTEKLDACEITLEQAASAITRGEVWVAAEQVRLDALREAVATAKATLTERQRLAKEHEAAGRPEQTREEIAAALADIEARHVKASKDFIAASSVLHHDDQAHARIDEIKATLDERREKARVWGQLDDLIGSADGAKFRRFAQSLTLNYLIHLANRHLTALHPRYELQRAPGGDLALQVIDHNMADEVRGVHNLSGGERFLVSLALALGLASMSSNRGIKVESLFIDEGFGALDSTSLAMAVSVLEQLQATGRRVGVISHVDELKERIAVRVEVTPVGGGRSLVHVVTA
jgi:DNA repair protein SbcC/Rad50